MGQQDTRSEGDDRPSDMEGEYTEEGNDRRVGTDLYGWEDDMEYQDGLPKKWFSLRKLWLFCGPGFLMSIAFLDPGNLEGDLQAGAHTGYRLAWVLIVSTAAGFLLQSLAAKMGVSTGQHLAQHCRKVYPRLPRYALWIMTEIAIIGSDIQEVIGSAIAISILTNRRVPIWAGVLITACDSFAILLIERLGVRVLEAVFAGLIGTMAVSFGVMYFWAEVPTSEVIKGMVIPRLPRSDISWATAMVGAIIMPHNIYLHSALVLSRKINSNVIGRKKEAANYFYIESAIALVLSFVINTFVLSVFAKGFYGTSKEDVGLENAGNYLGDTFGPGMKYIWAIGLLAAGQSSTMTGTYSGQFVMGGFLNIRFSAWLRVTITRCIAILPTLLVAVIYRKSRGNELDVLNEWLNVLNSVQLPFALIPVLTMTNSSEIVGKEFKNQHWLSIVSTLCAVLLMAINVVAIFDFAQQHVLHHTVVSCFFALLVLGWLALIFYLTLGPKRIARIQGRFRRQDNQEQSNETPLLGTE